MTRPQSHCSLAVWPWVRHLAAPCLSFPISNIEIGTLLTSSGCFRPGRNEVPRAASGSM